MAQQWAARLQREYNEQVDLEKKLGLPFMEFMAGCGDFCLAKGEIGFISFVAKPWYDALAAVFPGSSILVTCLSKWSCSETPAPFCPFLIPLLPSFPFHSSETPASLRHFSVLTFWLGG